MRLRHPVNNPTSAARKGLILIVVLVVTVMLSLAAYQYSDLMTSEYKATGSFTRAAQARAFADSGVHYAAGALATPTSINGFLNGNPFSNPAAFQGQAVNGGDNGPKGYFSIISAIDPDDMDGGGGTFRYGVTDEGGKINLNALMKLDPSGDTLNKMLMLLPNMTQDVADAICDWLDPDDTPRANGAESDYYSALSPPCRCKNGPIDSLEELLLVKGVTPQLLFGDDVNRNGVVDPNEDNGNGPGWSAYLTIYSRELNVDSTGNPRIYLNDTTVDPQTLLTNLSSVLPPDLATFIVYYRLYGASAAPATGTKTKGAQASSTASMQLSKQKASNNIASIYDLINTYVSVPASDPKSPATIYASPLNDQSQLATLLPQLLDKTTTTQDQVIYGRINATTATKTVLSTLPGLQPTDVTNIMTSRPAASAYNAQDPTYSTPAWLMTQAKLPVATMKALEKYVTGTSQVYKMQVIGYFDPSGGPFERLEAVVDANGGAPRIVYVRPLSELGRGFDLGQSQ